MPETGVKLIKYTGGSNARMVNNQLLVIEAGKPNQFEIAEWYPDTPVTEKNKVNWELKDVKRKQMLKQLQGNAGLILTVSKKYSGSQALFYLDATAGAGGAKAHHAGLMIRPYAPPLIVSSQWRLSKDGENIKNGDPIRYGDTVFLHLETEGLNGSNLTVEVYNQELGEDKKIAIYNGVVCVNGEVNLEIRNTYTWRGIVSWLQPVENFYVKVREGTNYLVDSKKQALHAVTLKVKNDISNRKVDTPLNVGPVKMGTQDINTQQYELCKYSAITVTEDTRVVKVFNEKPPVPAKTKPFEVVAGTRKNKKKLNIELTGYNTDRCQRKVNGHKDHKANMVKNGKVTTVEKIEGGKLNIEFAADLSNVNTMPFLYIWPAGRKPDTYVLALETCRYSRNLTIKVYPDIKWELEFKWNHDAPFAFMYGHNLQEYSLKDAKEKGISSAVDSLFANDDGSMAQSFELALKAKWDKDSQSIEVGNKIAEKIARTLGMFVKVKTMVDDLTKQVKGNLPMTLEIKSPAIAASIGWYLDEQTEHDKSRVATIVQIKAGAEPLIGAEFTIDLLQGAVSTICPPVGKVLDFLRKHFKEHLQLRFDLIFSGEINVKGDLQINTLDPSLTKGSLTSEGVIKVDLVLKALAKGKWVILKHEASTEGEVSVKTSTGVTGSVEAGADEKGIYLLPAAKFNGLIVTIVVKGSVKYGAVKKTFDVSPDEVTILKPASVKFNKDQFYLNH